jgi:hypothetical protein
VPAPREEWIAVPVPDAGIPRQWVLSAREVIRENEWASNAGYRTWKLAGGVLRCDSCGRTISVNYIPAKERGYYRCTGRYNGGVENRCSAGRTVRADEAEAEVWKFVRAVLTDPARLAAGSRGCNRKSRVSGWRVSGSGRGILAEADLRDRAQVGAAARPAAGR